MKQAIRLEPVIVSAESGMPTEIDAIGLAQRIIVRYKQTVQNLASKSSDQTLHKGGEARL